MSSKFTIIGHPRSGANLLRYIIQRLLDDKTPLDIASANRSSICTKTHEVNKIQNTIPILIIRDYRESIPSHILRAKFKNRYRADIILDCPDLIADAGKVYFRIIEAFHGAQEPKLVVYYEDLIKNTKSEAVRVAKFVGASKEQTSAFLDNLQKHLSEIKEEYHSVHGRYSDGELGFYSGNLTADYLSVVRAIFTNKDIAKQYLERYDGEI